jgi:hypothetical protein
MTALVLDAARDICYNIPTMNDNIIEVQNARTALMAKIRDLESSVRREVGYIKNYKNPKYNIDPARREELIAESETRCAQLEEEGGKLQDRLAPLEAQRISLDLLPHADLLKFFQGNNADTARNALELFAASKLFGSWVPGASRRVRAGLNYFKIKAPRVARGLDSRRALEEARAIFKAAMAPLEAEMQVWDSQRPPPTFTTIGASPTITANLKLLGAEKAEPAPMKREWVEALNPKTGKVERHLVVEIVWPEGTQHGTSQYRGTCNNSQCESCGHAIKNPFNWVPILVTCTDGSFKSLWVGRDCAKTLFGIDMTGDLEIKGGVRK